MNSAWWIQRGWLLLHDSFIFTAALPVTQLCMCLSVSLSVSKGKAVCQWSLTSWPPHTPGLPPYIPCPACKTCLVGLRSHLCVCVSACAYLCVFDIRWLVMLWLCSFHSSCYPSLVLGQTHVHTWWLALFTLANQGQRLVYHIHTCKHCITILVRTSFGTYNSVIV